MPRGHIPPNPQLVPLAIAGPGSLGLNLQQQNIVLDPGWSIESSNTVIDANGRVAARGGLTQISSGSASPGTIQTLFEYVQANGTKTLIIGSTAGLTTNKVNPCDGALNGSIGVGLGRWYMQNFNGKCVAFSPNQAPVYYNGTGTFAFASIASGTAPVSATGVGCAAYGRIWALDTDGQTIKWCALLDETNWSAGDAGSLNMEKVWPKGTDTVQAIVAFNGTLAIFGRRQIVFYGSTNATVLGLDVTSLTVVDVIEGTGTIGQWTVSAVGETDLIFCSPIGIQSIARLLVNRSRPTTNLSKYVRDALIVEITQEQAVETSNAATGCYSPTNGFYALALPNSIHTWVADQRKRFTDDEQDEVCRMTRWALQINAMVETSDRTLYVAYLGNVLCTYGPGNDTQIGNFPVIFQMPWMDFAQEGVPLAAARLKALKRLGATLYVRNTVNVSFTWFADFAITGSSTSATVANGATSSAEWGTGNWGVSEWSGGLALNILNVNGSGIGQYFSLQITAVTDSAFAIQQVNLLSKLLRIA